MTIRVGLALAFFALLDVAIAGEDYSGKNLAGRDFAGQRLLEAKFEKAKLSGAKFRGAILRGASFNETDLTGADFRQADVRGASFSGASGLGSDPNAFRNALYNSSTLWPENFLVKSAGATLIESTPVSAPNAPEPAKREAIPGTMEPARGKGKGLDGRPPSGVDMQGQDLSHKTFIRQYLNGANFDATKINFTTFNGAELQGATFRAAVIIMGYFKEADLTGADFSAAQIQRANFAGAKLAGANLEGANLLLNGWTGHFAPPTLNPDFKYSYEMKEAMSMAGSDWMHNHNLSLKGAKLRKAKIAGNLETVDLRKADLRGADLSEATNAEARFLKGAIYDSATIWWHGFDPVKAGLQKEESAMAETSPTETATATTATLGKGIAGYFWRVSKPGEEGARLLFIYPDGQYSWGQGPGENDLEKTWADTPDTPGTVTLNQGPGGKAWTASLSGEHELSLSNGAGQTFKAERGEAIKP